MSLVASFLLTVGVIMTEITMMTMTEMLLVTFLDTLMMTVYVSADPSFITVITSGLTTFTYFDFYQLEYNTEEMTNTDENGVVPETKPAPLCVPESDSVRMMMDMRLLYSYFFFLLSLFSRIWIS